MCRLLCLSVLLAGMFFSVGAYADEAAQPITTSDQLGPAIEQPIEFPHFRHAGDRDPSGDPAKGGMEINCMYCHTYARRSMVSGIPPLRKCLGCHQSFADPGVNADPANVDEKTPKRPRIQQLADYWKTKQAIPWKKVHDLPDFVRFNHERHIQRFIFQQAGSNEALRDTTLRACGYCHGDVKTMTVARRQKPITMGWCVDCHQKNHKVSATSTQTARGPNDCFTCHK